MNKQSGFLLDKVLRHDLVLVHVTGAPGPQVLRAKIAKRGQIYFMRSAKRGQIYFMRCREGRLISLVGVI